MDSSELNTEAIIKAGEELQSVGRNITGFALRQKVGGGNPNRLKQVWDEYVNRRNSTKTEPVAEPPVGVEEEVVNFRKILTERIAALVLEMNEKAAKVAERRVAEVVRAADQQREQTERELADASRTVDDLQANLDEANASIRELERGRADAHATIQRQAAELAQLRQRLALTEQVHEDQRKQADEEAHRMAERVLKTETDRDNNRKEATAAREEAARLREQVDALQTQAADLMHALGELGANGTVGRPSAATDKGRSK